MVQSEHKHSTGCESSVNIKKLSQTLLLHRNVESLTLETTVKHPGSHQHEGEQEEDEVVVIPRTCNKSK